MKTLSLVVISLSLLLTSCNSGQTKKEETKPKETTTNIVDASKTIIYYFHGKQRCKTCIAVGDLAKKTIEETYANNSNVQFMEVNTSEKEFADLVERYEVSWNALIIAKGDKYTDITEQAFANAVNSPDVLENMIKEVVNKNI